MGRWLEVNDNGTAIPTPQLAGSISVANEEPCAEAVESRKQQRWEQMSLGFLSAGRTIWNTAEEAAPFWSKKPKDKNLPDHSPQARIPTSLPNCSALPLGRRLDLVCVPVEENTCCRNIHTHTNKHKFSLYALWYKIDFITATSMYRWCKMCNWWCLFIYFLGVCVFTFLSFMCS